MAGEGMDLIVTSGGLGPTADDLTAEVVGRFAGREMVLDEEMEEKIAAILRAFARRWRRFDDRGDARGQPQAGDGPARARRRSTPRGRRRGSSSRPASVVVIVLPGPAARAAADVAAGDRDGAGAGGARPGDAAAAATRCGCSASRSRRSPAACVEIEADGIDARTRSRSPPACGAGRSRSTSASASEAAAEAEAVRQGLIERHRQLPVQRGRDDDRRDRRRAAARAPPRPGRVLQRRPDGVADHLDAGRLGLLRRQRRHLLERGQGRAARRRPGADRAPRRGLARGRRGDGDRRAGALRAPTSRSRSPASPAPDGGSEEKPVGYVCFNARLADGTSIARDPVIPGGREDIRERSSLVGMHLLRTLLGPEDSPI